eukprot:5446551-Alexandrium_andersonii.AAC.1
MWLARRIRVLLGTRAARFGCVAAAAPKAALLTVLRSCGAQLALYAVLIGFAAKGPSGRSPRARGALLTIWRSPSLSPS